MKSRWEEEAVITNIENLVPKKETLLMTNLKKSLMGFDI